MNKKEESILFSKKLKLKFNDDERDIKLSNIKYENKNYSNLILNRKITDENNDRKKSLLLSRKIKLDISDYSKTLKPAKIKYDIIDKNQTLKSSKIKNDIIDKSKIFKPQKIKYDILDKFKKPHSINKFEIKNFPKLNINLRKQNKNFNKIINKPNTSQNKISISQRNNNNKVDLSLTQSNMYSTKDFFLTNTNLTSRGSSSRINDKIISKSIDKKTLNKDKITINTYNNKTHKIKLSKEQRQRIFFDKFYGLPPGFEKTLRNIKKDKNLPLEEYQNKMLTAYSTTSNFNKDYYIDLSKEFNNIKEDCEKVSPLPPFDIIKITKLSTKKEEYNENSDKELSNENKRKRKRKKMIPLKELIFGKKNKNEFSDLDIPKRVINRSKFVTFKQKKAIRNLDFLPPYIAETFKKKVKFIV